MHPLYFEHPHDDRVWDHPFQWMLGDSLLVAPVLEPGATSWTVYLPAGEWIDAFTGQPERAGLVSRSVPLDELPVYVRAQDWDAIKDIFG